MSCRLRAVGVCTTGFLKRHLKVDSEEVDQPYLQVFLLQQQQLLLLLLQRLWLVNWLLGSLIGTKQRCLVYFCPVISMNFGVVGPSHGLSMKPVGWCSFSLGRASALMTSSLYTY
jgi:hypothetical protein